METTEIIPQAKRKRGRPKGSNARAKGGNETAIVDPIISPYKIYIDERQYNIVDKDQKPDALVEKSYGYFPNLGGALNKIVKLKMSNNKQYSLKEYINEYKTHLEAFRKVFDF